MNDELQRAFEETHYIVHHVPPFTLRIGLTCSELDALLQATGHDCAAFITAWNPMSEPLPEVENRMHQQRLVDELTDKGYRCIPGIGQHPDNGWPGEESVLVPGLQLGEARLISKAYRQWAFVWAEAGQPSQRVLT